MDNINQTDHSEWFQLMVKPLPSGLARIQKQLEELDALSRHTVQDMNTIRGTEQIAKWKAKTVTLLTEVMGPWEGQKFSDIQPGPSFTNDLVEEFIELVECYRTALEVLADRLAQPPRSSGGSRA